ncbi:MAG: fructosamine kinase [Leeuwenhoekiella sp.]|nr:fructosamine kinase [Leeuwenhoekiella sp.]|tara:strand:+ start:45002 stop:45850 length:849 start_codon:yes stop_codon:yes gene_type:complete
MLNETFKEHLSEYLDSPITQTSALTGGDINDVYKLDTRNNSYVVKTNDANAYPDMFKLEKLGLDELAKTKTFRTPCTLHTGNFENKNFLILEYIASAPKTSNFDQIFGEKLAKMHQTSSAFGFIKDNYIGSLPQHNDEEPDAASFYISQRLEPQFRLAQERGYTFDNLDSFYSRIENLIPDEAAALIHGDLWSGNFMVSEDGQPALIDPATCYAPREMDLALMRLFGGFSNTVFESYERIFPLAADWEKRIELWQLYYILVHVNLFGGHYYASAKAILRKYL